LAGEFVSVKTPSVTREIYAVQHPRISLIPLMASSDEISVMHRKSIGHSRRKHGEHGTCRSKNLCRESPGNPGPVIRQEVLPNGTTTGVPTAAATCIGPVSLVSTTSHALSAAQSSRSEVSPARRQILSDDTPSARIPVATSFASSRSERPPRIQNV